MRTPRAGQRLALSAVAGVAGAVIAAALTPWQAVPLAGWDTGALLWVLWVWLSIGTMDEADTAVHARREDPSRAVADLLLLFAAVASLAAVAVAIGKASSAHGHVEAILIVTGVVSVIASWLVVQTVFSLRYAAVYFGEGADSIEFNDQRQPVYSDFAYLAFTVGMTYQVSDTNLRGMRLRRIALRHALLSFLFGTVIVATTINLIAGLVH
jgi:uncharacterized membrane protein